MRAVPRRTRRLVRLLLPLLLVLGGLVGISSASSAAAAARTLYVSPAGSGTECTPARPCALTTAVSAATAGSVVQLAGGSYGNVDVRGGKATTTAPVTVRPATGATATFGRLGTYAPNLVWKNVTVTITFYIYSTATGTTVDGALLDGGGMFLRSNNVTVRNSEFRDGSSLDGIQISRATNVLVENNYVHDYNQTKGGSTGYHADCIQIYDANKITLRGNTLANCYNAGIIFSPGSGWGVNDVLVESNFVQGCLVKSAACNGGTSIDLRYTKMTGITVRNNTFLDGAARITTPGAVFDRNIVDYLSDCGAVMTNTVVARWNLGLCRVPSALGNNGNRYGVVDVVNRTRHDLRPVDPAQTVISPVGARKSAALDRKGTALAGTTAGATAGAVVEVSATSSRTDGADGRAPDVRVTSPTRGSSASATRSATFTASATDDKSGVRSVQILVDTVPFGAATLSGGQWKLPVNTLALTKGRTYHVVARATDAAGNTADSVAVPFSVR
ncbi:hypothetical protein GIS00_04925 [Nakamurella sp. YIM 132087]|uniref:Right handed beta helix domain-containing protein n=1 Tax=Nakamurella alba TaxID=2665158 RepID=A0A7K1FGP9_9ACTN|nr:right-handed parallel beta-helix repeat-containing protein [Nakamurella alba]MTD13291.1 hypothetical protein [Nakamurella alba]